MIIGKYLLIGFGILFVLNLLLTAFGGLHPGRFRQGLNKIVFIGGKWFLAYLAAAWLFFTFQGLSKETTFGAVVGNIFVVGLVVIAILVMGSDFFFPDKGNKQ